jgi:Flp pilus assembly protein TadB
VSEKDREPPFEGGSQPVPEHPPEVAGNGRTVTQTVALVVGALVIAAAVLWLLVPLLGS